MHFQIVQEASKRKAAEIAILAYWEDGKKLLAAFPRKEFSEDFLSLMEKDFSGKSEESLFGYMPEGVEKRVLLIGLGKRRECNGDVLRKAFASALSLSRKKKLKHLNLFVPQGFKGDEIEAILDGLWMANYSYDALKREAIQKKPTVLVEKVALIGCPKEAQANIDKIEHVMGGVNLTRDLVNGNADEVKASFLVQMAKNLGKKFSAIDVKVLGKKELEKEGMGLMLAVNRGAAQDPALILMHYRGDPKSDEITAVVGKGVTYDTGGLNLKPTGSMETMKCDMAGSAAVAGLIQACASLKLKKNVLGVIASVENAIGSNAYKPGDVYISHAGKSVEISNTDAEGRLVLADAFSYVQKYFSVDRLIDFATLTGGVIVALGDEAAGLFSNDKKICDQLKKAADVTGERIWELPLYPEYLEALKSSIADLKNARKGRQASASSGAMFLKQFVKNDLPWAHLDIAGTAYLSENSPYNPSHATGVGVKLMIEFLQNL